MLLYINYGEVLNTGVRGVVDGKKVNFHMVVNVDETNFQEAIDRFDTTKGVVAFNYVGAPQYLQTAHVVKTASKPILHRVELEQVTLIDLQQLMIQYPSTVRVVLTLPKNFNDMRFIYEESKKYPNLRFEGGNLLRLGGCSIGALGVEDIPRKISLSRLKLNPQEDTEFSAMKHIDIDDVDDLEFYVYREAKGRTSGGRKSTGSSKSKVAKAKTSKPKKKQLSSLLELTPSNGLDNF